MNKTEADIRPIGRFAEEEGYPDIDKLAREAADAGALLDVAGVPHISVERWNNHIQELARKELGKRSRSVRSLADTDQLGIINSNLKRLPEAIRSKEREVKALEALLKGATSDIERYGIRGKIARRKAEVRRHKGNLKKAMEGQKRILAKQAAELEALESLDSEDQGTSDASRTGDGEASEK